MLEILAACERSTPTVVADGYRSYARLKVALTDAIVATLTPIQGRYAELVADPTVLAGIRRRGAQKARDRAQRTVERAKEAIGLA